MSMIRRQRAGDPGVWGISGHPIGHSIALEQGSRGGGLVTEGPNSLSLILQEVLEFIVLRRGRTYMTHFWQQDIAGC